MTAMRWAASIALAAACAAACGRPAAPPPPAAEKAVDPAMLRKAGYDDTRDPAADLAALIPVARAADKRILLVVGGEWCVWCHYLHDFLERETEIKTLWDARFETLHVNYSEENKNTAFLSRYPKIPGYPHIFVLDKNGVLVHSEDTSLLESGRGYSREAVKAFLDAWSGGERRPSPSRPS
jgi:thiol:disulfide interchange protein